MKEGHTIKPRLSLPYLLQIPKQTNPRQSALIMLHGYGSNEADLFALAGKIPTEFLVISVRAPLVLGEGQCAWFSLDWSKGEPVRDKKETEVARVAVKQFIDEAVEAFDIDPSRLFLLGFSQGAILSMAVALTFPGVAKGVIALSGRVLEETKSQVKDILPKTHYFIGHGVSDQVLPVHYAREAKEYLAGLGADVEYHEYPIAHTISMEEIEKFVAWLGRVMQK
jgi:phospholipase/carboxylesterase